ncbi:nucleotidyltransferase domain-containing protein [Patescibacteria group bacterium]|nr:nucleotidyltransferase domain-containing protein [Patescibacteria group bacterium]MBU1663280.1 nucleotidyltransferase domain-containing protein [Patescibacteria group bacterium]MBU1933874.1 nucleotidyltransferase domain-containing protein [Patescibacteria group bacterium]MBU2007959.1 nucleotidyltransferase domain-containing protein [Patescibacteria group bacterium]MBU2233573.1 nucleotidyltransferase domain-containing protein [Patescibacteria group bacterium]
MIKILTKKQLNKLSRKYCINVIYLFGSQAEKNTTNQSDYDFAVLLDEKIKPEEYGQYQIDIISELLLLIKTDHIDLIILNNKKVPLLLKYNIIKQGKLLYEKKNSERIFLEVDILRHWFDWQYFEEMWGNIYIKQMAKGKIF